MNLSSTWYGAIGSATLSGLFAGSLIFGRITDRFGRKLLFLVHLIALLLLSCLNVLVIVGLALAYPVKVLLDPIGSEAWRWLLASSAVPAVLILLLRIGAPESPRWLLQQGRHTEARAVLDRFYGTDLYLDLADDAKPAQRGRFRELFSRNLWRRTVFAGGFWACQGLPYYSIYVFQEQICTAVGIGTGVSVLVWCSTSSCCSARWLGFRSPTGRRAGGLLLLSFALFGPVLAAATNPQSVYLGELFPTHLRATGVGVATAISRIGACLGTFLLPIAIDRFGSLRPRTGIPVDTRSTQWR